MLMASWCRRTLVSAFANGINDRGQVAGASTLTGDQTFDAFIWEKGKFTDLGNLGGRFLGAIGFSEAGDVVGQALLPDVGPIMAFSQGRGG